MSTQIVIQTYNAHIWKGTVPGFFSEEYKDDERQKEICSRINKSALDVIGLCEVWSDGHKKEIIEKTESNFTFSWYYDTPPAYMGSGLVMLSKLCLVEPQFEQYRDLADWDKQSQKGFISTTVFIEGIGKFQLLFTHTQSGNYQTERQSNLDQMRTQITHRWPRGPRIIMGDLNIVGGSEEYKTLMNKFPEFIDAWSKLHPSEPGYTSDPDQNNTCKHFNGGKGRLDYMLVTKQDWDIRSVEVVKDWKTQNDIDCSDHYPLKATLVLIKQ